MKPQRISMSGVESRSDEPSAHVSSPSSVFPITASPHHFAQSPIVMPSGLYVIASGGDGGREKYASHAALHMSPDRWQQFPPEQWSSPQLASGVLAQQPFLEPATHAALHVSSRVSPSLGVELKWAW